MSVFFFFSSRRRHTRWTGDWSSDVCSSDLPIKSPSLVWSVRWSSSRNTTLSLGGSEGLYKKREHMSIPLIATHTEANAPLHAANGDDRRAGWQCCDECDRAGADRASADCTADDHLGTDARDRRRVRDALALGSAPRGALGRSVCRPRRRALYLQSDPPRRDSTVHRNADQPHAVADHRRRRHSGDGHWGATGGGGVCAALA